MTNSLARQSSEAELLEVKLPLLLFILAYLVSYAFEGVVRYAFSAAGVSSLLYLRDLIPVFFVVFTLYQWVAARVRPDPLLAFLLLVSAHFVMGLLQSIDLFQALFGLKVLLPLIFGLCLANFKLISDRALLTLCAIVFSVSLAGVVINKFVVWPWEGAEFVTTFAVTEQSRAWTADGVRRLAGFARASFDAASVLLLTGTVLYVFAKKTLARAFLFCLTLAAIFLTTSKGALLAFVMVVVAVAFSMGGRRLWPAKAVLCGSFVFVVSVPLVALFVDVSQRDIPDSILWWASSFVDRMEWMWPRAWDLLIDRGSFLVGRGPGGIGVAQQYGEWRLVNAGDNVFMYWTVVFGFAGSVYAAFFLASAVRFQSANPQQGALAIAVCVAVITYGLTANVIEQPLLSFSLGFCCSIFVGSNRRPSKGAFV